MFNIVSITLLHFLIVILYLQSTQCKDLRMRRVFWRPATEKPTPRPTLPSLSKDPEFYRKLREEIPPKEETAHKLVTNFLRIRPGSKRSLNYEDTVIVMDGSGSIGECEFGKGKEAMARLVGTEPAGIDVKIAMTTFGTGVTRNFNFVKPSVAEPKIRAVTYPDGSTNTQAGLEDAFDIFLSGGRGLARKVVLLLTDGHSNVKPENTIPNADRLKDSDVEIFVVAVGGQHISGIDEMAKMATSVENHLFRVKKVGDFFDVVNLAIKEAAPGRYVVLDKNYNAC